MSVNTKTKTTYFVQSGEVVTTDEEWAEYQEWEGYETTEVDGVRVIWSRYGPGYDNEDDALTSAGKALKTYLNVRIKTSSTAITHTFS